MAEGAPVTHRPLSFDEVQRLGASSTHSKVLPTLCLVSHAGDPPEEVRILGYLVRCRTNGFMVILPGLTTVQSVLDALVGELGSEQLVYKLEEANLEDSRGRRFGKGSVYLVDFSAECALFFSRAPALRGAAAVSIHRLKVGDSVARPAAKAAWQMSEAWIAELGGEDEAIQEYFTADSDLPGAASEEHSPSHTYGPGTPDEAVGRLEAQVRDLQDQLARAMQSQQPVPPRAKAEPHRGVAPPATLFDVPKSSLDASTLLHLKQLAGPAPGKLTRLEEEHKQAPEDARASEAQDQFAELQAGVLEDDELAAVIAQSRDPLHQILALQLKQTAALTQRLSSQVPRDQITAALGNEPGSSSSNGVRGFGLPGEPSSGKQGQRQGRRQRVQRRCKHQKAGRQRQEEGQGEEGRRQRGGELRASRCHCNAPTVMQSFSNSSAEGSSSGVSGLIDDSFQSFEHRAANSFCNEVPLNRLCPDPIVESPDFDLGKFGAEPISFLDIMQVVCNSQQAAHLGLSSFLQSSLQLDSRDVHRADTSSDPWPCPPPCWSWTGPLRLSPRRRRRRRFLQIRAQLLQQVVGVLNWETLGHPVKPPQTACSGQPYTDVQWNMLCRLERLITHFLQAGDVSAATLGRSGEKFSTLMRAAKELPDCQDVDLIELVGCIASDLDAYSRPKSPNSPDNSSPSFDSPGPPPVTTKTVAMPSSVAKPVVASRVKWEHSPSFDPIPFLTDPLVKDAFVDPANVRLPATKWVDKPKGRVHCSRIELLRLAEKWDTKGACRIFRVDEVQEDEAVGIFTVPKDEHFDRLILNPQRVNARLQSYSHFTKSLAPGSLFSLIRLEQDQVLRLSADDLAEMYYTVKIPEARAKRNCIGIKFKAHELSHLTCFNPDRHFGFCFVALNALAMGDSWAVEFAQQAHHNVLRFVAGCMLDHERVAYRKSFPRSSFMEWLSIDDHIGAQVLSRSEFQSNVRLRDTEVFDRAGEAYTEVGLVQHPKKKRRGVLQGIFLGAEIDGDKGLVSAPRDRIASLMLCTMIVARKGCCSPKLLSSLPGCWVHVLLFRRPLLAVLSHAFSEGSNRPQNQVFQLSRETRNELCALALLGPVCCSDLRVDVAPVVFCTDASPAGGGICLAEESKTVVAELWRHSEQRGYYTQLLNPSAAILAELGLEHLDDDLPDTSDLVRDSSIRVPAPVHEGILYDCLELFRGEGNWSRAHAAEGFRVHAGVDVKGSSLAFSDMLDDHVFHQLVSLAARGVVRDWHAGPPCYTYGTLRRPRLRSRTHPAGFNINDPLTREQTRLALRTAFLMFIVVQTGLFFSVEQPGSSVMFR